jgi:predicted GNAT superfamily acetyltransferase
LFVTALVYRQAMKESLPVSVADVVPASPLAEALLTLNNRHAEELSWLTPERLTHLVGQAFFSRRIGQIEAFLLAFDQQADYDSPNFLWFRNRYPRFVYIDRIVVAVLRGKKSQNSPRNVAASFLAIQEHCAHLIFGRWLRGAFEAPFAHERKAGVKLRASIK